MPAENRLNLRGLVVGAAIEGAACIRRLTSGTSKDGKAFLTVELSNVTGSASGKVWSEQLDHWSAVRQGQPVWIAAKVKPGYRGGAPELAFVTVAPLPPEHDVAVELNPMCPVPLERLKERFDHLTSCLTPAGQALLDVVLDHVGREAWFTAPAAKSHHHHQIRGLAMHSLEVGEIAMAIAQSISVAEHLDYDALLVGALLHDVGKIEEYTYGRGEPIDLSRGGLLSYHTVSGGAMVAVAAASARQRLEDAGVHRLAIAHLMHVIASHHGQKEWGSPAEPRSLEAQIIHVADLASARTRSMLDELESDALQPDGWAIPTAWGRKPVFSLRKALERAGHRPHARQHDDAAPEATVAGTDCVPEDLPCRTVALLLIRPELGPTPTPS